MGATVGLGVAAGVGDALGARVGVRLGRGLGAFGVSGGSMVGVGLLPGSGSLFCD